MNPRTTILIASVVIILTVGLAVAVDLKRYHDKRST